MNRMPCSISGLLTPDDYPEIEEVDTYDFDRQRKIDDWFKLEKELRITRSLELKREGE